MLSVLIPIYNRHVTALIQELHHQLIESSIEFEMICMDDCSSSHYQTENSKIQSFSNLQYIKLDQNIGRSKIRNRLARQASYHKLLFLDSDSEIRSTSFIENYLTHLDKAPVLNGGRIYTSNKPTDQDRILHYVYGTVRESRTPEVRRKNPAQYFHTNNFIIERQLVLDNPFEESLIGYGYEDLALAAALQKQNLHILHINNPIIHKDLDTASEFLGKIEQSMKSLSHLYLNNKIVDTPILKVYKLLTKASLKDRYLSIYRNYESRILANLMSKKPSMRTLDMYKLYHFCIAINSEQDAS